MDKRAHLYGIPGLQTTRRDSVLIALQKLWKKIKCLEQMKQKEEKNNVGGSDCGSDSDASLRDVQLGLIELELKLIRKLIKERPSTKLKEEGKNSNHPSNGSSSQGTTLAVDDILATVPVRLEKQTQTSSKSSSPSISNRVKQNTVEDRRNLKTAAGKSTRSEVDCRKLRAMSRLGGVGDGMLPVVKVSSEVRPKATEARDRNKPKITDVLSQTRTIKASSRPQSKVFKAFNDKPGPKDLAGHSRDHDKNTLKTCAHSHYHMRLTDVPFIVGKSAGVSHSVIANVQSIIGMMKTHNRGLCTPAAQAQDLQPCWTTHRTECEFVKLQDMRKELKGLARELSDLMLKQEQLKQKLKDTQHAEQNSSIYREYSDVSKLMESKARDIVEFHRQLKGSSSDILDRKAVDSRPGSGTTLVKKTSMEMSDGKAVVRTIKAAAPANRSLMRSLKRIQEKLQEEDIIWS